MDNDLPYAFDKVEGKHRPQRPDFTTANDGSGFLGVERVDAPAVLQLHPDLARLAVRYQRIRSEHIQGRISDGAAAVALSELVARDDFGVHWSINQRDGGWQFLGADRNWHPGEPPSEGIATATAHALDKAAGGETRWDNPDLVITWVEPEQQPDSWESALDRRSPKYGFVRPRWAYPGAVAAVVVVALNAFWFSTRSTGSLEAPLDAPPVVDAPPVEVSEVQPPAGQVQPLDDSVTPSTSQAVSQQTGGALNFPESISGS